MENSIPSDARLSSPPPASQSASEGAANALFRDAYSPAKQSARAVESSTQANSGHADWTLAIDLTASLGQAGAPYQFQRLQSIAKETKNVPVDLVVQVVEPTAATTAANGNADASSNVPQKIDRYAIHDGAVTKLGDSQPSRGLAADVTDLLQAANENAPSDHLGLIIQSHGGAAYGLSGDTGDASLSQLSDAISAGLKGGPHAKLDVLDFDSCLMANLKVAESMAPLASHMVASTSSEFAGTHQEYDAQNLRASVHSLLHNPSVNGDQFSRELIAQANQGLNDGYDKATKTRQSGTPTLAHFDLNQIPAYNERLNELGRALTAASADPSQRQAISAAIESTEKAPDNATVPLPQGSAEYADLRSFATNLQRSVKAGEIKDAGVDSAAGNLLKAQNALIPESHTSPDALRGQRGQMSAFLPDRQINDVNSPVGPYIDGLGDLLKTVGPAISDEDQNSSGFARTLNGLTSPQSDDPAAIAKEAQFDVDKMQHFLGSSHSADIDRLREQTAQLAAAKNGEDSANALDDLRSTAIQLQNSDFGRDVLSQANNQFRDDVYRSQTLQLPDWQAFVESRRGS